MSNSATYAHRRELAQRVSDGIEVTLYWGPSDGTVVVEVIDHKSDRSFEVSVPSDRALDAFHHPYAYASHQGVEAYREVIDSDRWKRLANEGARPQRLLWASTGTKDPHASDVLYVRALAAPFTVNTLPQKTLLAFGDHGVVGDFLPTDGGAAEATVARFAAAGVDVDALARRLQREGADAFVKSWDDLLDNIGQKAGALTATR